jgi:hypothetical protein
MLKVIKDTFIKEGKIITTEKNTTLNMEERWFRRIPEYRQTEERQVHTWHVGIKIVPSN